MPSMNQPRWRHSSIVFNNKLFVLGGYFINGDPAIEVESLQLCKASHWQSFTVANLDTLCSNPLVSKLDEEHILLCRGGYAASPNIQIFNPEQRSIQKDSYEKQFAVKSFTNGTMIF